MPIYVNHCDTCKTEFKDKHSIHDKLTDCTICETVGSLVRIPSMMGIPFKVPSKKRAGELVDSYIKETKREVEETKKRLKEKEYTQ